jgi:hypothetical protein
MSTALQNINLYLPEFRKRKHWLDASKVVLLAGATLAALVVASAVDFWQLLQARGTLADLQAERQSLAAATAQLVTQYGVQTEDPALLANIEELQQGLQSKQALLQFLEGRDLGNAVGFSEQLADLARYHVAGLSLSQVTLANGGVSVMLGGEVRQADLVTRYMQNLSRGNTYRGKVFETLQLEEAASLASATAAESAAEAWTFQIKSLDQP